MAWTVLVAALTGAPPDLEAWERLAMPDVWTLDTGADPGRVTRLARL
jgi:hypothetical protein